MDLKTKYLGLDLDHPIVASASPISTNLDGIKRLADAGAAAVVMHSLFEEQIHLDRLALEAFATAGMNSFAETSGYFPKAGEYHIGPEEYLYQLRRASESVSIPVIASLNGVSEGGWTSYAAEFERAGASAIELNIYWVATNASVDAATVEDRYIAIIESVRSAVSIPIAVKLSPYFSSFASFAKRVAGTGVEGVVLFNRFYQPDIDLDSLEVVPNLELSTPAEIRQGLLWIAVLVGQLPLSIAASTGVHSAEEAIKYLLVGADVVMTTSSLLHNGPGHIAAILQGLKEWMASRDYQSIDQLRGSMSQRKVKHPGSFERANYLKMLHSYSNLR